MADNFAVFFTARRTALVSLWLLTLALLCLRPLSDLDLFTQLRLGAIALSQHTLVRQEPLVYRMLYQPIANPGWLSQILFAALAAIGGLKALKLMHDACFAAALALPLLAIRSGRGPAPLPALLTLLLALMVCASNSTVRAQGFALFAFALLVVLCERRPKFGSLLSAFVLFLFWQNVHQSLSLASLFLLTRLIDSFFRSPASRRYYLELFLLSIVCQILTPDGTALLALSARNAHISRVILGVSEWLPPWDAAVRPEMSGFWIALAITALFIGTAPKKLAAALPYAAWPYLALSLYSSRFAIWWALIMIPFWHEAFSATPIIDRLQAAFARLDRRVGFSIAIIAFAIGVSRPLPLSPEIPIASVRRLAQLLPEGRVYNYREWAGPLVYFGSPQWQVGIDGRLYLYSPEEWQSYNREAAGEAPLDQILESQDPAAFFLRPSFQKALLDALRSDPRFEICTEDELAAIVLPRGRC